MKLNFVLAVLMICCLTGITAYGQQDSTATEDSIINFRSRMDERVTNVLKTNPLALLYGCIPGYTAEARLVNETAVSLYQTFFIGASYLFKGLPLVIAEQDSTQNPSGVKSKVSGWRVQAGYKFYINGFMDHKRKKMKGLAPKGLYFAPHISYATARLTTNYAKSIGVYYRFNFFNVDIQTGYQLIAGRHFAFDAFTGLGYMKNDIIYYEKSTSYNVDTEDSYFYNSNVKFVFGFNLGYAF
jgi:hypothetical protein